MWLNRPFRVVASYTTLPSRYNLLLQSIRSLQSQTFVPDVIYLTIPRLCKRLKQEYPPIPEEIKSLCKVVIIDTDYGPITKLYGALVLEDDPNTVIISCDDDVVFNPNFIEVLVKYHRKFPSSVICGTGALIGKGLLLTSIISSLDPFYKWNKWIGFSVNKEQGRKVDLIFGVAGVLYTRSMFPCKKNIYKDLLKYSLMDDSVFHNDDVLISGYLSKKGIERRVFLDVPIVKHYNSPDALSLDAIKMVTRLSKSIKKVKEFGFFTNMEDYSISETLFFRVFLVMIVLLLIVFVVFYKSL